MKRQRRLGTPTAVAALVAALVLLAAAAAGCGGEPRPAASPSVSAQVVVRVDGEPISNAEVAAIAAEQRLFDAPAAVGSATGDGADAATRARDEAPRRLLVRRRAAELKLSVDEAAVRRRRAELAAAVGGEERLAARLTAVGLDERGLDAALAYSLLERRLQDRLFAAEKASAREVDAFYRRQRTSLFATPAAVRLRVLTVATQAAAKGYAADVRKGASLAAIARRVSLDRASKEDGGLLGWVVIASLPDPLRAAVDPVKVGELSRPVRFLGRWHLYQVLGRRPARARPLPEVRSTIAAELTRRRRAAALDRHIAALRRSANVVYPAPVILPSLNPTPEL